MRVLLLILLLWPDLAVAGAWPRAPGEYYVSTGQEVGADGWSGVYAERGGPGKLTFGLDAGGHMVGGIMAFQRGETAMPDVDGRAFVFVRMPLAPAALKTRLPEWVFAGEVGLGADFDIDGELELTPRLRLGLSAGRPLETPLGNGWTNLDLRMELGGDNVRYGLGAVVGVRPRERLTLEIGLFAEMEQDLTVTFIPTVQYAVPWIGDVRLGVSIDLEGEARLNVGIARTF